jgi:peroxiredoxin
MSAHHPPDASRPPVAVAAAGARKRPGAGDVVRPRDLATVAGERVAVPDPAGRLVHLQFRRFAGCPVCNLHLRSFVRRHDEIAAAGIREVVLFHSTAADLRPHTGDLPFAVVADPDKALYAEFGVESAPRALADPRAWLPIARAILASLRSLAAGRHPLPPLNPEGGRFGLPADFLIGPDGRILACRHGAHAYDQWSVDDLLDVARRAS